MPILARTAPVKIAQGSFAIFDARQSASLSQALVHRLRPKWIVISTEPDGYFVFTSREFRNSLKAATSTADLMDLFSLDRQSRSHVFRMLARKPEIILRPGLEPCANRAVFLGRSAPGRPKLVNAIGLADIKPTDKSARVQPLKIGGHDGLFGLTRRQTRTYLSMTGNDKQIAASSETSTLAMSSSADSFTSAPLQPRVEEAEVIRVYYGTDRSPSGIFPTGRSLYYGNERSFEGTISYGYCDVSVPVNHQIGQIEAPALLRFQLRTNRDRHFIIDNTVQKSADDYFVELRDRVASSSDRAAFVFIHGYNVNFATAIKGVAQLASDLHFPGPAILYSWPSCASAGMYTKDTQSAMLTREGLVRFLRSLIMNSSLTTIHLIAHSLGSLALVGALEYIEMDSLKWKLPTFEQIVFAAPDVARDHFIQVAHRVRKCSKRVTLYASKNDKALKVSARLNGHDRAGYVRGTPLIVRGVDSIDASNVDVDLMAHSTFSRSRPVITDMFELIRHGLEPAQRAELREMNAPDGRYWAFKR
jgi:esterase/lipase superfamily enzyme